MKAFDQQAALAIRAFWCLMQLGKQPPVREHLPCSHPQPRGLRRFKQRSGCRSEMRTEYRRCSGSMRNQRMHELAGHVAGMRMIRHAGLFGQRAVFQPIEQ